MYTYKATVKNVVDGDTVDFMIDLGLSIFTEIRVRLYGINTPELHSADAAERVKAKAAASFLTALLNVQVAPLIITTHKDTKEKYGRYLVEVQIAKDENGVALPAPRKLAEYMIEKGYGMAYFGGAR